MTSSDWWRRVSLTKDRRLQHKNSTVVTRAVILLWEFTSFKDKSESLLGLSSFMKFNNQTSRATSTGASLAEGNDLLPKATSTQASSYFV